MKNMTLNGLKKAFLQLGLATLIFLFPANLSIFSFFPEFGVSMCKDDETTEVVVIYDNNQGH